MSTKPHSAYALYVKENRKQVVRENPQASFAEIGVILGRGWKTLCPKERERYEEMAAKEKEEYLRNQRVH